MIKALFTLIPLLIIVYLVSLSNTEILGRNEVNTPAPHGIGETLEKAEEAKSILEGKKPGTRAVDVSNQGLTKVSPDVFKATDTIELNLSYNKLTGALPGEIRFLANLKVLNLSYNEFTGVPGEIGQLSNLEVLDLSYNKITGLPYELGNLGNLKVLILTGNPYSDADLTIIKKSLPATVRIETN